MLGALGGEETGRRKVALGSSACPQEPPPSGSQKHGEKILGFGREASALLRLCL